MALALRLFLLLLLAVALHARAAQAAPVPARGADGDRDFDYLEILVDDALKFLEQPGAKPGGDGDQEPGVGPRTEPPEGRVGPPRGKNPAEEKKSQESLEALRQILKEMLQKQREMDQEAVHKLMFPEGSSGSVPGSAAGREAMPGTGTRDAAGATINAPKIQESIGRGFCSGARCLAVIMASVLGWQLVIMLCCAGIWYWWERKRLLSAPAPAQQNTSVRRKQIFHLSSPSLYPAMLPQLQNLQVQEPPKRAPLPLSPLVLHSNQV
ncbi:uncharacterized protein LOC114002501 isoform X1 [Pipra filicauda]|uniref:Uncharacterized protein LOC114002501 isoform X1 n=1 Tax=Pipra filicauda TaxID=649802 RepID=A0A7R5KJ28_9PASS|nr:uncharacterized protein LOC114002501 isoform X1 [Pipra filicauda]